MPSEFATILVATRNASGWRWSVSAIRNSANSRAVLGQMASTAELASAALPRFLEPAPQDGGRADRSEEHTSELQSLMRISYAVFCLKKKKSQYIQAKSRLQSK